MVGRDACRPSGWLEIHSSVQLVEGIEGSWREHVPGGSWAANPQIKLQLNALQDAFVSFSTHPDGRINDVDGVLWRLTSLVSAAPPSSVADDDDDDEGQGVGLPLPGQADSRGAAKQPQDGTLLKRPHAKTSLSSGDPRDRAAEKLEKAELSVMLKEFLHVKASAWRMLRAVEALENAQADDNSSGDGAGASTAEAEGGAESGAGTLLDVDLSIGVLANTTIEMEGELSSN